MATDSRSTSVDLSAGLPASECSAVSDDVLRQQLLTDARHGSQAAFGQLLEIYRPYLQMVAEAELSSEIRPKVSASDLVQDSFLEAQHDFLNFRGTGDAEFRGWLRQVLINNLKNVTRAYRETEKRSLQREVTGPKLAEYTAGSEPGPSVIAMHHEERARLHAGLLSLPEHLRQVIFLRSYERLSFEEIGLRMQRTADAARHLWVRAVERLKLAIAEGSGAERSDA